MTKMKNTKGISDKLLKLDEIVKYFEDSNKDFDLDDGLSKYDEAMSIVKTVKEELQSYELKIREIQNKYTDDGQSGNPAEED